jgi:hypothetical protein
VEGNNIIDNSNCSNDNNIGNSILNNYWNLRR